MNVHWDRGNGESIYTANLGRFVDCELRKPLSVIPSTTVTVETYVVLSSSEAIGDRKIEMFDGASGFLNEQSSANCHCEVHPGLRRDEVDLEKSIGVQQAGGGGIWITGTDREFAISSDLLVA